MQVCGTHPEKSWSLDGEMGIVGPCPRRILKHFMKLHSSHHLPKRQRTPAPLCFFHFFSLSLSLTLLLSYSLSLSYSLTLLLTLSLSLSLSLTLSLTLSSHAQSCHRCTCAHLLPLFSDLSCAIDHTSNAFALAQVVPKNRVALHMVAERR